MLIKVTFQDQKSKDSITLKPFYMEILAALWFFMDEHERKEYCIRSFFSSCDVNCEEVD